MRSLWCTALLVLVGCAGVGRLGEDGQARTYTYELGVPNFDIEAIGTLLEGKPGLDLYIGISRAGLIYNRLGDRFVARYEWVVRVLDRSSRLPVWQESGLDSVVVRRYEETQRFEPVRFYRRIPLRSGTYQVEVIITDAETRKSARRLQQAEVPDLSRQRVLISRPRLEVRTPEGRFEPHPAQYVPADADSVRVTSQIFFSGPEATFDVRFRLLRFRSDTSIAAPPFWVSPGYGSLAYLGIDYARADTIQQVRRTLRGLQGELTMQFLLPRLEKGNYRIEILAVDRGGIGRLEHRRDFAVRGPGFPHLTTWEDLIGPLYYITTPAEWRRLQAASTEEERRREFDRFWGSLFASEAQAQVVMRAYYSRVEEANLLFSGHKEGWKTDRGMLYIVFGAPLWVDRTLDYEVWRYTYAENDPVNVFVFQRARPYGADQPFEHFILQRQLYYEREWYRRVERWRRGEAL